VICDLVLGIYANFMSVSERQKTILDMIIREYVESARPVSSQYLGERYDFGICPASIRIEMQKLTDDGFLTQPHTSAGRIPTDKGYRLFVDQLAEGDGLTKISLDFGAGLEQNDNFDDFFGAMRDLAQSAAAVSEALVLGYMKDADVFFKEGWEEVLRQPEFGRRDLMDNFLDYLDYLENNIEKMKPADDFEIFIGQENPFPKAKELAVFSMAFEPAPQREVIFSLVGPKRMAYDKNIALTNEILKMFNL